MYYLRRIHISKYGVLYRKLLASAERARHHRCQGNIAEISHANVALAPSRPFNSYIPIYTFCWMVVPVKIPIVLNLPPPLTATGFKVLLYHAEASYAVDSALP